MEWKKDDHDMRAENYSNLAIFLKYIEKGNEYETIYNDFYKACELYTEAGDFLKSIYGEDSNIVSFIKQYTYIEDEKLKQYKTALLKLAEAGNFVDRFEQSDVVDDLTKWIYENKKENLKSISGKTWFVYQFLGTDLSFDKTIKSIMFHAGDPAEGINEILFDAVGLPRSFQYLITDMLESQKNVGPDKLTDAMEALSFLEDLESRNVAGMSDREKKDSIDKVMNYAEKFVGDVSEPGGYSQYLKSILLNMDLLCAQGYLAEDKPEKSQKYLDELLKNSNNIENTVDLIKIDLLIACLKSKQGNAAEAKEILQQVLECEDFLMRQVFTMIQDIQKIQYLNTMERVRKAMLDACLKIEGCEGAYKLVLRYRTLTVDYTNIYLDGEEGLKVCQEKMRLENEKRNGKNVDARNAELEKWFEETSQGIFTCEAKDVMSKLSEHEALLEFTRASDEHGADYYLVFVILSHKVLHVVLDKCSDLDENLNEIYYYMSDFSRNRYSLQNIRQLPAYWWIYQHVVNPIGECIPSKVKSLYIVQEGGFDRIPFEIFPSFQWYDSYLGDEYKISYLNTGRELLMKNKGKRGTDSIVIGAPDFSQDTKYPPLPASLIEVDQIAKILGVEPFTGLKATKNCIKDTTGILHISTHSFFDNCGGTEDPMEKTGLVFAKGERLSAREVGALKLHHTELAVLSVCNEIQEANIYNDIGLGLRRAFINAGAKHMIMNLWKLDDNASTLFMQCFYTYYIKQKMEMEEALKAARFYIKEKTADEIVLEIIKILYPEWIKKEKKKKQGIPEYEQYAAIIKEVFQFDIERASAEQDHALDLTELERKIEIMKLNSELKQQQQKKDKKK